MRFASRLKEKSRKWIEKYMNCRSGEISEACDNLGALLLEVRPLRFLKNLCFPLSDVFGAFSGAELRSSRKSESITVKRTSAKQKHAPTNFRISWFHTNWSASLNRTSPDRGRGVPSWLQKLKGWSIVSSMRHGTVADHLQWSEGQLSLQQEEKWKDKYETRNSDDSEQGQGLPAFICPTFVAPGCSGSIVFFRQSIKNPYRKTTEARVGDFLIESGWQLTLSSRI